jgi:hypothetical protein
MAITVQLQRRWAAAHRGGAALVLVGLLGASCSRPSTGGIRSDASAATVQQIPSDSQGRRPAGTRADPFVGDGVVVRILKTPDAGLLHVLLKERAIPYFRIGGEFSVFLPTNVMGNAQEGDFVSISYAKLVSGSPAAREYALHLHETAGAPAVPAPYVYFGYELFRLTVIPDDVFLAGAPRPR